eukprot:5909787-Prymnesium_polylepis.1
MADPLPSEPPVPSKYRIGRAGRAAEKSERRARRKLAYSRSAQATASLSQRPLSPTTMLQSLASCWNKVSLRCRPARATAGT